MPLVPVCIGLHTGTRSVCVCVYVCVCVGWLIYDSPISPAHHKNSIHSLISTHSLYHTSLTFPPSLNTSSRLQLYNAILTRTTHAYILLYITIHPTQNYTHYLSRSLSLSLTHTHTHTQTHTPAQP